MKSAIFVAMGAFALGYLLIVLTSVRNARPLVLPSASHLATGFVTNFFDTLGIGSFATTTAIFKFRKMVPDELIPGTLNVGHTLPVIFQAFIYLAAIEVDVTTLVSMIGSATVGAWFGAGFVARLPRPAVQLGMGIALITAAAAMLMSQFHLFPPGGEALQLSGWRLAVGVGGNFLFGAISTLGIGFYAPCMTLVSLLGMNPAAAFPIMMGSGAFLMPVASARFVWSRAYYIPVAIGLAAGGMFGVPLAAFVVKSLPLTALRWLVIVVVLYAAALMLRSARDPKS
ncbi:MAG: sulfite exporter TauE/SafE family protein [Bryobacteraceae bacterium]